MCSYDRAERFPPIYQRTLPRVGPSTYYLPEKCDQPTLPHAPFLSCCPRSDRKVERVGAEMPSAADYNVVYRGRRVTGGNAMGLKDTRFKQVVVEGPGPGQYDIRNQKETKAEMERTKKRGRGKLYQCRVPYQIGESPPTIPHRTNCHGYEIDKLGALTPNPPSYHDMTLGPAFYETLNSPKPTCEQYRGVRWCASQSKRSFFEAKEGPGPGTYDVGFAPLHPGKVRDDLVRSEKRKCSKQPRLAEIIEKRTQRENLPGPGYYNIEPTKRKKRRRQIYCAFLSSKQRFTFKPDLNPGPGAYEVKSTLCPGRSGSLKSTCFLREASRFPKGTLDQLPGPGDYEVLGTTDLMIRKNEQCLATRIPGFNSCTERLIAFQAKDAAEFPAPNHYQPKDVKCIQSACTCSAVFKSQTERWKELKDNGQASCATYHVDDAYRKLIVQQSHRQAAGKLSRFASCVERFGPVTDIVSKRGDPGMPGPSHYRPDAYPTLRKTDAGVWGTAERFFNSKNDIPGPGHYKLHPKERETTLKGTYNSTLGNPLPNPMANVKPWLQNPAAKKMVRWFAEDYNHCQPLICCRSNLAVQRR